MRTAMVRKIFRFLRALALVWLLLVVVVGVFQRTLIYFPSRASEPELLAEARARGLEPWRDAAGTIIGWQSSTRPKVPPANRLLVFHGNAGYAVHRGHYIHGFEKLDGGRTWEVHVFEYPGYGARPGPLGETPINAAAHAAFTQLAASDPRPIFLLGESLGSGPACALAGREPQRVAGLCLVTPFARLVEVAAHRFPFLPVRLLLRDPWDNVAALAAYRGRLFTRLAGDDEVIPTEHGQRLFDGFAGPKRLRLETGAHHNGLDYDATNSFWEEATAFLLGGAL